VPVYLRTLDFENSQNFYGAHKVIYTWYRVEVNKIKAYSLKKKKLGFQDRQNFMVRNIAWCIELNEIDAPISKRYSSELSRTSNVYNEICKEVGYF